MTLICRQRRRLCGEQGFTLVELMMAAMVAAIGVGALTTVLIGSRQLTNDAERGDSAAQVAEREMERTLSLPYANLALAQAPSTSSDPLDPRYFASGGGSNWTYKWNGSAAASVLIDATNGQVIPSTSWNDGRTSGAVTVNGGERRRKPVQLNSVVFP